MTKKDEGKDKKEDKKEEKKEPAAASKPDAKPAAKPAPKPAPKKKAPYVAPTPVFNTEARDPLGQPVRYLHGDRMWPTTVWKNPWSLDRYRWGAVKLAVIFAVLTGGAFGLGEISGQLEPSLIGRVVQKLTFWITGFFSSTGLR